MMLSPLLNYRSLLLDMFGESGGLFPSQRIDILRRFQNTYSIKEHSAASTSIIIAHAATSHWIGSSKPFVIAVDNV